MPEYKYIRGRRIGKPVLLPGGQVRVSFKAVPGEKRLAPIVYASLAAYLAVVERRFVDRQDEAPSSSERV